MSLQQKQKAKKQIQLTQMKQKLLKSSISNIRKLTDRQQTLIDDNKSLTRQIFVKIRHFQSQIQNFKLKMKAQYKIYKNTFQQDHQQNQYPKQNLDLKTNKNNQIQNPQAKGYLLNIKQLAAYLQQQKLFMKNLVTEQTKIQQQTADKLHTLLNKKKFEEILVSIKKKQLEEQIRFIETNILLNSGISYDIQTSLQHQEEQLKNQIAQKVKELQRVMNLNIFCEGIISGDQQHKQIINELDKQTKRLETVQKLLNDQKKRINNFQTFLKNYTTKVKQLPIAEIRNTDSQFTQQKQSVKHQKYNLNSQYSLLADNEVENLKQFQMKPIQQDLTVTYNEQNDVEQRILNLRKKIRKLQQWVK